MFETANPIAKYYFYGENTIKNYDSVCLFVNYSSKFYCTANSLTQMWRERLFMSTCDIESQCPCTSSHVVTCILQRATTPGVHCDSHLSAGIIAHLKHELGISRKIFVFSDYYTPGFVIFMACESFNVGGLCER